MQEIPGLSWPLAMILSRVSRSKFFVPHETCRTAARSSPYRLRFTFVVISEAYRFTMPSCFLTPNHWHLLVVRV
jgi:hypothetical protein